MGREGEPISIWVDSNLDSVEFFLNGKSQGSRKVERLTHLEWSVKYEPGALEARGTKDEKIVLTEKRETMGGPVAIKITADRAEIDANGEDLGRAACGSTRPRRASDSYVGQLDQL